MASLYKLTPEQVDALVAAYLNGCSTSFLATTHDVTGRTITNYLERRGVPRRPRGRPRIHAIREDYFDEIGDRGGTGVLARIHPRGREREQVGPERYSERSR